MKKFLIGILTAFITIAIMILGLSMNIKSFVVDTVDRVVKKEVTNDISNYVGELTGESPEEIKKGIDKVLNENETIKNIADNYFDIAIDIMMGKTTENINIGKDLENVINSSDDILKEYGINLSEKDKQELIEYVSSDEVNNAFNETISEFKSDMPSEVKTALEIFNFFRSTTFKLILVGIIILFLGLIALLKKSTYKWLSNLGGACIISGIVMSLLMPFGIDTISRELNGSSIVLSSKAFSIYGYIVIGIGLIAIILNIVISKLIANKKDIKTEQNKIEKEIKKDKKSANEK